MKTHSTMSWPLQSAASRRVTSLASLAAAVMAAVLVSGCSSLEPSDKTNAMRVVAVGIPGIAFITHSSQSANNAGDDTNAPQQANPITVTPSMGK